LSDYFVSLFADPVSKVSLDFFRVESKRPPLVGDKTISLEFEGVALFNPGLVPTVPDLDILLKQAFTGASYNEYLEQLKTLPEANVFATTTAVMALEGNSVTGNQESSEDSSKMPLFAVLSIAAGSLLVVALAFVLYRRKGRSSEKKENDSITAAEESCLVEPEIGPPVPEDDNDYSVCSSGSIKRAEHVLRLQAIEEDNDDSSFRASPRLTRFRVVMGN
jgi:hypothetical protein